MGLLIVKQIVEQSGGKMFIHSDGIGTGSLFMFNMKLQAVNITKVIDTDFGKSAIVRKESSKIISEKKISHHDEVYKLQ